MTFQDAIANDPLVNRMVMEGSPLESIVGALASRHAQVLREFVIIHSIAPKKYRLHDGTIRVWHCPEEMLPIRDIIS